MIHHIKKGKFDSSTFAIGIHFGKTEQNFKVKFSKECLYTPIDWENDYNKLVGWSYGMHHTNSIRVCWRPYVPVGADISTYIPTQIQLCIYIYESGKLKIVEDTHLGGTMLIDVEQEYEFNIERFPSGIVMLSSTHSVFALYSTLDTKLKWGYILWPYFGGNNPAPQNMDIELIRL